MRRILRALTSPVRSFFNEHFNMVKADIAAARSELLGAGADLARQQEVVAVSAEKVRDAATFLGMRLGTIDDDQVTLAAAVARIEERLGGGAGAETGPAGASLLAVQVGFVVGVLTPFPTDGVVAVQRPLEHVAVALQALCFRTELTSGPRPADALVLTGGDDESLGGATALAPGTLVIFVGGTTADGVGGLAAEPHFEVTRTLAVGKQRLVATRLR